MATKKMTVDEAIRKIEHYCAYQERCHQEVNEKLKSYKLFKSERDDIIVRLIETGFLNEERFAKAFVRGRFNQKHWGRNKIIYELKSKRIHERLIQIALSEIDEKDYYQTLQKLIRRKLNEVKSKSLWEKKQKLINYFMIKGYETELVIKLINDECQTV